MQARVHPTTGHMTRADSAPDKSNQSNALTGGMIKIEPGAFLLGWAEQSSNSVLSKSQFNDSTKYFYDKCVNLSDKSNS